MSEPTPALPAAGTRHELPSGGWVELRNLESLRARDTKAVMRSLGKVDLDKVMSMAVDMTDALIAVMVTDWKLPYGDDWSIPSLCVMRDAQTGTPVVLEELTAQDYATIRDLMEPAQKLLFPGKPDPTDAEDPASPTAPANA